jgi:arginase
VADDPVAAGREAITELAGVVDRWWLHIDLDVLDPVAFPSQGLPDVDDEPGGLTWDQLTDLVVSLFGSPAHCVGASLAIYDADQDEGYKDAAKIVNFVRNALARTTISP